MKKWASYKNDVGITSTGFTFLAIFSMMVFGTSFWAIVIALEGIPPITLGFLRALIAFIFMILLFIFLRFFRGEGRWLRRKQFWYGGLKDERFIFMILGSAFFGTALPNMLQNTGMLMMDEGSTSSLASLIQGIGPVFTIVLAAVVLKERLGPWRTTGLVIAIPSTIVLTTYGTGGFDLGTDEAFGGFLNVLTALSYSISGLFLKSAFNRGAHPVSVLTLNSLFGAVFTLPFLLFFWFIGMEDPLVIIDISGIQVLSLLYLSVCVYAVAAIIFYKVMRNNDLSGVMFFVFLLPVFSTLLGYILLDERLSAIQVLAALVLLVGVFISQITGSKKKNQVFRAPVR